MPGSGVTLQDAKDHVRLDGDESEAELILMIDAAEDYTAKYLGRSFPWTDDEGAEVDTPTAVRHAILMMVADLYEHRTATVDFRIRDNPTFHRLLDFHRAGIGV